MRSTFNNTPEYIPEAAMTDKISLAVEKFPKISMQIAYEKQQGVASDNFLIITGSDANLKDITPDANSRVTPNLECSLRWIHTIGGRSHSLLWMYTFHASMSVHTATGHTIIGNFLCIQRGTTMDYPNIH